MNTNDIPTPRTKEEAQRIAASGVDWHHSATLMKRKCEEIERENVKLKEDYAVLKKAFHQNFEQYNVALAKHHDENTRLKEEVVKLTEENDLLEVNVCASGNG